jgi:hypothetical protein
MGEDKEARGDEGTGEVALMGGGGGGWRVGKIIKLGVKLRDFP